MSLINLKISKGFSWYSNEKISVKGCFFDSNNNLYQYEKLTSFFSDIQDEHQFLLRLNEINGFFTVVIKLENKIFIACDTTRVFPLFYSFECNQLSISDDIDFLKKELKITEFDEQSSIEFKSSGYTMGDKTLLKNVYQSQSNEYLIFKNDKIHNRGFFFNYSTIKTNESKYPELISQSIEAFENSFKRLVLSLNNCTVALPLSGGYDSRLIAVMLKKYNYNNVICYTYGKKNNKEIENSRKTAEALNFKWIFIEHSVDLIQNYINTNIFKEYAKYTGKYSSMPFLQEYFAVKYLFENNLIPSDSIFIPGFAGDLLGGSQYEKVIPSNLKLAEVPDLLLKNKFFYNTISEKQKSEITMSIKDVIKSFDQDFTKKIPSTIVEDFDIKEKISKFIFNSANIYTFFNYEHRFPYWDKDLLLFFKNTPIEHKKLKLLYDEVLKNNYFKEYKVNFESELQPTISELYKQKVKDKIKPFFPYYIKRKYLAKNNWQNFEVITTQLEKSISDNNLQYNSKIKSYNELFIQWYLFFSKGKIKK